MGCCTISGTRTVVTIIFVILIFEVVGCHHVIRLCYESVKCFEDEKIRVDRFINGSYHRELDQLRLDCNRRVLCEWDELGCEFRGQNTGRILKYSCIKDTPKFDQHNPRKSGTILSRNYPNPIASEFQARLSFNRNVTLKLTFHDVGHFERLLYLTVYSFQGKNWTKYNRLVTVGSRKSFTNAKIFDISIPAERVWITYTVEEVPKSPVTIRHCSDNDQSSADCQPKKSPPQMPLPESKPEKPESKSWLVYAVVISVLSTIILVAIIFVIWKRFSSIKCTTVPKRKCQEQRPDILTHFPSDGNIITGDILAQEMEAAAAAEAETEAEGNRNNSIEEDDEQIDIYETIAVPHYTDFPRRPRPSLPAIPIPTPTPTSLPQSGLVTYIEVISTTTS